MIFSRPRLTRFVLATLGCAELSLIGLAQSPTSDRPSFEVASVKPNAAGDNRVMIQSMPGGRFRASSVALNMLMTYAYRVRDFQIVGGPDWMRSDRWDIQAKAEEGSVPPSSGPPDPSVPDPLALRTQSLLEEQFHLKFHRETRELPLYELVVAKNGPKLQVSEDQTPLRPPERGAPPQPPVKPGGPMPRGSMRMSPGTIDAAAVPLSNFIMAISQQLGRSVIDKTELKGLYDIKLQWTPEFGPGAGPKPQGPPGGPEPPPPPADPSGPSIFTAIQEQLGLRLVSTKGPVEVLVIDGAQKPEN